MHEPTKRRAMTGRNPSAPETSSDLPARASEGTTPELDPPARESSSSTGRATLVATPEGVTPVPVDGNLAAIIVWGETLDDLEKLRIATSNRVEALRRDYGSIMPELSASLDRLKNEEHSIELAIKRAWRKHPLAPWAKSYRGLGEKSAARLIASIGEPAARPNPAKLWSYCGVGDPARKRRKGMSQEEALALGNPRAKKQLYLIATSMLKAGNRTVYDEGRVKYAEREWTDGHRHMAALRLVEKRFLVELWQASRAVQKSGDIQGASDGPGFLSTPDSESQAVHNENDAHCDTDGLGPRGIA